MFWLKSRPEKNSDSPERLEASPESSMEPSMEEDWMFQPEREASQVMQANLEAEENGGADAALAVIPQLSMLVVDDVMPEKHWSLVSIQDENAMPSLPLPVDADADVEADETDHPEPEREEVAVQVLEATTGSAIEPCNGHDPVSSLTMDFEAMGEWREDMEFNGDIYLQGPRVSDALGQFRTDVLHLNSRQVKQSIDSLVDRYFTQDSI